MTEAIVNEFTDLSGFDKIEPPCDYELHGIHGSGPAVWVITFGPRFGCGCRPANNPSLACNGCWTWRNHLGIVVCRNHSPAVTMSTTDNVLKVERL